MTQCDLNKVNVGSITGRAEVIAAVDGLVEEMAHLRKTLEQAVLKATAFSEVQAVEMAEAANFPISPQHDRR